MAAVVGRYEEVVLKVVILARFIPLALALAEGITIQAVPLAMHALHHDDIKLIGGLRANIAGAGRRDHYVLLPRSGFISDCLMVVVV